MVHEFQLELQSTPRVQTSAKVVEYRNSMTMKISGEMLKQRQKHQNSVKIAVFDIRIFYIQYMTQVWGCQGKGFGVIHVVSLQFRLDIDRKDFSQLAQLNLTSTKIPKKIIVTNIHVYVWLPF